MHSIPYQANRTLGVLSKVFNLAEIWGQRPDGSNPCRHVKKYPESKRERYLTLKEIGRLGRALDDAERDRSEPTPVIAAIRLLILAGARLGEIQTLKWEYVHEGHLALPDSKTGAKRIVLGKEAAEVLHQVERVPGNPYVIVGTVQGQHWTDMQRPLAPHSRKSGAAGPAHPRSSTLIRLRRREWRRKPYNDCKAPRPYPKSRQPPGMRT